jgi:hypothetical protein
VYLGRDPQALPQRKHSQPVKAIQDTGFFYLLSATWRALWRARKKRAERRASKSCAKQPPANIVPKIGQQILCQSTPSKYHTN